MRHRNKGPRVQLNLNIPERLYAEMEAARIASGVKFKQDGLCEAIAIWNLLKEPLRRFRSTPDAMDCANEQKFAAAFLEWLGVPELVRNKSRRDIAQSGDVPPPTGVQYNTEPLSSLAKKLNEILDEIRAQLHSGKKQIVQTPGSQEESIISIESSGSPTEVVAGEQDEDLREIDRAIDESRKSRKRIERSIETSSDFIDDIERECVGDPETAKRTA